MQTSPTVSVIIPVYNGGRYLSDTLATVRAQTLQPVEIIIVDDGSTDDTAALIEAEVMNSTGGIPLRVITQQNQRQSAARNAAAAEALGELLAFLDQDDSWHSSHLSLLTEGFAADPELGWTYSDFDEIDGSGSLVSRNFIALHRFDHPKTSINQFLGQDCMMLPSASVIRASAFREVNGFDPRLCGYEDDDLFLRLFRARWRSRFVEESVTVYRVHGESSSARSSFRESRWLYFTKIATAIPDDIRMNRSYVSHLLLPRLLHTSLNDYSVAVRLGHDAEAREMVTMISDMCAYGPLTRRRRLGLKILGRPALFRFLCVLRAALPASLRPPLALGLTAP